VTVVLEKETGNGTPSPRHSKLHDYYGMTMLTVFVSSRNESDPAIIAKVLGEAEAKLAAKLHPDPYICSLFSLLTR
jgi:hypothetical protein